MSIDNLTVKKISNLSKLKFTPDQEEDLKNEFDNNGEEE